MGYPAMYLHASYGVFVVVIVTSENERTTARACVLVFTVATEFLVYRTLLSDSRAN